MPLTLRSASFQPGGLIPRKYSCDGADISPHLAWFGVPDGTLSFVLICDDPDSPMGIWDHWLLYNIPGTVRGFEEAVTDLPAGTKEGINSWEQTGYGGPCPPDKEHRYFFKLYALDSLLQLSTDPKKSDIESAMEEHVIAQTELMGRYDRPR